MSSDPAGAPAPAALRGRRLGAGVVFIAALAVGATAYSLFWHDFQTTPDALEYADIARQVVHGRGFVTWSLWPNDLSVARPPYTYPVHRSPLACLALVPSVALGGTHPLAVLAPSMIWYAVLAAGTWWVGSRLFGRLAGGCAVGLLLSNYNMLVYSLSGYPDMLFSVVMGAWLVGVGCVRARWPAAAGLGVLLGLSYLVRTNALAMGGAVLVLLVLERRFGLRRVGLLVGAALVAVLPCLAANWLQTGSLLANSRKYIMLFHTPTYPRYSVHGYVQPPEPLEFFWQHPDELMHKLGINLAAAPGGIRTAWRAIGLVVVVAGLIGAWRDERAGRLPKVLVAALTGQLVSDCLTVGESRFLAPLVPIGYLFGGAFLAGGLKWLTEYRRALVIPLVVVLVFGLLYGWGRFPRVMQAEFGPKPHRAVARAVRTLVQDPEELVAADLGAAVCWYAGQRVLHLPASPPELARAEALVGPIRWVVVSVSETRAAWRRMAALAGPAGRLRLMGVVEEAGRPVADVYEHRPAERDLDGKK